MATVPTYIYIGGGNQVNGGVLANRPWTEGAIAPGTGGLHGIYRLWPKFAQTVPSDPTTGLAPAVPDYTPYWDKPLGAWVVYHHSRSKNTGLGTGTGVVPNCMGDNHYEFGGGITPTTMMMQLLKEKHATAPYFKFFKIAVDGGIGVGAGPLNGLGWTSVTTEWDTAEAAAVGDTLDVQAVILDAACEDIVGVNLTYEADLQTVIDNIRTKWGTDCLILLVTPHVDVMKTSLPGATAAARSIHTTIARTNDDVVLFDMGWAKFAPAALGTYAVDPADPLYYDTESYIQAGVRMYNAIEAWRASAPAAVPGSGIAVVAMVTDSQGKTRNPLFAYYGNQGSLLGAVGGTVRAGQYIWNAQTRQVELYDVLANPTTCPEVPADSNVMGFEATLLRALYARYPDGVVVFKYAKNGAALTSEAVTAGATGAYESGAADLYTDMTEEWNDFRRAVFDDLDRTPDCIGCVVAVGDNDTFDEASGTAFAGEIQNFVTDLRALFTTRSSGDLPIVWLQPPQHLTLGGTSNHGIATAREAIRTAVAALDTLDAVDVLNHNATRYELDRGDLIHYGGEATLYLGDDFGAALLDLIDATEGETATTDEDVPSGAAAFTVETGSGAAGSNSYCSVADADAYHLAQGNPSAWANATTVEKQDALRQASTYLDYSYGGRWSGVRATSEQGLDWPRLYAVDSAGNEIDSDEIPTRLVRACAVAALLHVRGETLVPTTQTGADIASEDNAVGAVSRAVTYRGAKPVATVFPIVERMLMTAGLATGGSGWGASVV